MDTKLIIALIAIGLHYIFLFVIFKDYDKKIENLQYEVRELKKRN